MAETPKPEIAPEVADLMRLTSAAADVSASIDALNELYETGRISVDAYAAAMANLEQQALAVQSAQGKVSAGLSAQAEQAAQTAAGDKRLLHAAAGAVGPVQSAIAEVANLRQGAAETGNEFSDFAMKQVGAEAGFQAVAAASQTFGTALAKVVITGKASAKELRKALGESMAGLAVEEYARAVVQLALGIAASTPWGLAALGPPQDYFRAAAAHAAAGTAAAAATRILGAGAGSGSAGARPGGGGGGGVSASNSAQTTGQAQFSKMEERRTVGGPFEAPRLEFGEPFKLALEPLKRFRVMPVEVSPQLDKRLLYLSSTFESWGAEVMAERREQLRLLYQLVPTGRPLFQEIELARIKTPEAPPVNINLTVHAVDAKSFDDMLQSPTHKAALGNAVYRLLSGRE